MNFNPEVHIVYITSEKHRCQVRLNRIHNKGIRIAITYAMGIPKNLTKTSLKVYGLSEFPYCHIVR